jgi:tRNA-2-methylthio-N6-dimethylallyladenosine synthase
MRRSYRSEKYLGIIEKVRERIPGAAITTDIIVGFPGETEEDFLETMRVAEASRFAASFTFQYSKRPGTPAADLPDQLPKEVVQERYERLLALCNDIAWKENQKLIGQTVEVLVANGEGRKDAATERMSGRARDNRLVHFEVPAGAQTPRPGDIVTVRVTEAKPYFLLADAHPDSAQRIYELRRTRAGDAWDLAQAASCGAPAPAATKDVPGRVKLDLKVR